VAYSTLADIKNQLDEAVLVQLTDDEGLGIVDEDRVTRAIADADEEIDGYVGARHALPLSTVPAILRKISVDLAVYNLYTRRSIAVPEIRSERYKSCIRFLEQVGKGAISLGSEDPGGSPPGSKAPEFSTDNPDRVFDREKLEGF
jgi:phage gp36-like protein